MSGLCRCRGLREALWLTRRLIGDERLVVLLEASELAGGAGGAGAEAKKEPTPMIVRGHRHVADVLAGSHRV